MKICSLSLKNFKPQWDITSHPLGGYYKKMKQNKTHHSVYKDVEKL